mgnify:FL=1|jgi:hypothetical protein|tara:strand:- start:692 stop:1171 length:480 start_codon:yes stop_codon:yes gene_type:complete
MVTQRKDRHKRPIRKRKSTKKNLGRFRSGLEVNNACLLKNKRIDYDYETIKLEWVISHKYLPDFILPNGIVVETKGMFVSTDRRKHLQVKAQHPDIDIRFVFSNSNSKLYKGSKSTYADWCVKNGFKYADKLIPLNWLKEKNNEASLNSLGGRWTVHKP